MLLQDLLERPEINLNNYELKKLADPGNIFYERKDIVNDSSQENIQIPPVRLNSEYGNPDIVLKQENIHYHYSNNSSVINLLKFLLLDETDLGD